MLRLKFSVQVTGTVSSAAAACTHCPLTSVVSSMQTGSTVDQRVTGARRDIDGTLTVRLRELYASVPAAEDAKQQRGGLAIQQLLEVRESSGAAGREAPVLSGLAPKPNGRSVFVHKGVQRLLTAIVRP